MTDGPDAAYQEAPGECLVIATKTSNGGTGQRMDTVQLAVDRLLQAAGFGLHDSRRTATAPMDDHWSERLDIPAGGIPPAHILDMGVTLPHPG